jgi:hypothetical protein
MKWRIINDQVELGWVRLSLFFHYSNIGHNLRRKRTLSKVTGVETENLGYIVEKRPSYGGDFQEIATYNEVTQLLSKGPSGGR